jgi:carbon storage regulator
MSGRQPLSGRYSLRPEDRASPEEALKLASGRLSATEKPFAFTNCPISSFMLGGVEFDQHVRHVFAELQGKAMLVLSRKKDEKIVIGDNITVMVIEIRGDKVRLGIEAPKEITVHRQEVYDAIKREQVEKRDISIDAP